MQIVILAAGLGSRLGKGMPKALVEVAGKTMLEYQVEWTRNFSPDRTIVISGYHHEEMKSFCEKKFPFVEVIENKRYSEQNLYSLLSAEQFLNEDTLIMNVDHIYPESFAVRVSPLLNEVSQFAIFADTERKLTDDDMKVFINSDGYVEKISKKLTEWNAGYIGMTFIKKDFWKKYLSAASTVAKIQKEKAVVEMVIQELVDGKNFPEIINSDKMTWYEIDTPEELKYAENCLPSCIKVSLFKQKTDTPDFAGVNVPERWQRAIDKLDISFKRRIEEVNSEDIQECFKVPSQKTVLIFTDWIVDDVTVESALESVYSEVSDDEFVSFTGKNGVAPLFIIGRAAQQKLSVWEGWKDENVSAAKLVNFAKTLDTVKATEKTLEKGYWGNIKNGEDVSKVEWEYLKFLQFRPGGVVAKYLNRPVSIRITRNILKYKFMTPNFVTVADFFIGLLGLACFLIPGYLGAVLGGVIIHFNSIVDGVDGEIVRMRHQGSSLGAWLDSICDETLGALLYLAIGYHLYISGGSFLFLAAGIITAVASYTYALVHWHCKYKHGLGFYYWWECYKPRKEVQRSTSLVSYLKKLLWRDSILLIVMIAAVFNFLDVFLVIAMFPALVNFILIAIHIFIKKARW